MTIEIEGIHIDRQFETMRTMSGEMYVCVTAMTTMIPLKAPAKLIEAINKNPHVFTTLSNMEKSAYERRIAELEKDRARIRTEKNELQARIATIKEALGCDDWDDDGCGGDD